MANLKTRASGAPSTSSPVSLTTSTVNSTAKPSSPSSSLASSTAPSTSGRIQQEEVAEKDLPVVQEKPSYADVRERPTMGYTENVSTIAQTISRVSFFICFSSIGVFLQDLLFR